MAKNGKRAAVSARKAARDVARLVDRVAAIIEQGHAHVVRSVNSAMVLVYWHIGREIVEFVQAGAVRAEYGEQVIATLSARLSARVGRGYSVSNLRYFRQFFQTYAERSPTVEEIHHEAGGESRPRRIDHEARGESQPDPKGFSRNLSWTHYRTLLQVGDPRARAFYEIEAARERWTTAHLERQIHTQLFARLIKSRDQAGVTDLANRGNVIERPIDLIKSPVVLDFLELPDGEALRESDLEGAILSKLSQFLLELGKGFAFVARQKRLVFEDEDFYVDLVFYNVILKCYLLIDLKLGRLAHQDIGQMDTYVRLYDDQARTPGDGPTIGLILCAEKNEAVARYSILHEHEQLFTAKYVTYLPTVEELERELARDRLIAEASVQPPRRAPPTPAARARAAGSRAAAGRRRSRRGRG